MYRSQAIIKFVFCLSEASGTCTVCTNGTLYSNITKDDTVGKFHEFRARALTFSERIMVRGSCKRCTEASPCVQIFFLKAAN